MSYQHLPLAEKQNLKLGYMQLTDSAPLILARELGLFEELGLSVELVREVSWANIRDRLVLGDLDAAQILSPLPMMTSYGAGGIRANILTGLVLSLNGNAITISGKLSAELGMTDSENPLDPLVLSKRLHTLLQGYEKKPALTFATVHLFSMHTILLRIWLAAGGIDPDHDVRIIVLPPAQMCDSLARGIIDGYCVGEPWNTVAVSQGLGSVASSGYQIWNNAPEKVLGVTENWHQNFPGTHLRLRIALMKACQYLAELTYREKVLDMMSGPAYLNIPRHLLMPSMLGEFRFSKNQAVKVMEDFHVFWSYQAGFPWRSCARKMLEHCSFALARPLTEEQKQSLIQTCFRTDLYREAARYLGYPCPTRDYKPRGLHAGLWEFEPGIVLGADMIMPVLSN